VEKTYHIAERSDSQGLAEFFAKNGQALLPMMELVEQARQAI
jgi:hypothetical protein